MAMLFRLNEFGRAFSTRGRGRALRKELGRRCQGERSAIIDFDGITNVSYSFADELVGVLSADESAESIQIELATLSPSVEPIVRATIERRSGSLVDC